VRVVVVVDISFPRSWSLIFLHAETRKPKMTLSDREVGGSSLPYNRMPPTHPLIIAAQPSISNQSASPARRNEIGLPTPDAGKLHPQLNKTSPSAWDNAQKPGPRRGTWCRTSLLQRNIQLHNRSPGFQHSAPILARAQG
jgi:hypothetical protein